MNATILHERASRRLPPVEMTELSLLLPAWQIEKLAAIAHDHDQTIGQMLRGMIQKILHQNMNTF